MTKGELQVYITGSHARQYLVISPYHAERFGTYRIRGHTEYP